MEAVQFVVVFFFPPPPSPVFSQCIDCLDFPLSIYRLLCVCGVSLLPFQLSLENLV